MYNQNRGGQKQFDNTNRGGLFPRNKTTPKSPDMGGDIEIGGEVLDYILANANSGQNIKLYLSAWREQMRGGGARISLSVRIPAEAREGQAYGNRQAPQPRQPQQRGGYGQAPQQGYGQQSRGGGYQQPRPQQGNMQFDQGQNDLNDDIPF